MLVLVATIVALCCIVSLDGFSLRSSTSSRHFRPCSLYMGRAAAVRANTKAKTDGAKAKLNARYGKKIVMAVKAGGPDPVSNVQLANVIAEAQRMKVPKDIVTRNLDRAKSADTADFTPGIFEFYGFGGVGLVVNSLTDNLNRCNQDIGLVAKKNNIKTAAKNSVVFKFAQKARIDVNNKVLDEDELMELCLENDVDDYQLFTEADGGMQSPLEEGRSTVFVEMKDMAAMRDALLGKEWEVETRLAMVPMEGYMQCSDADFEENTRVIALFEELDDVDSVEHNMDLVDPDEE